MKKMKKGLGLLIVTILMTVITVSGVMASNSNLGNYKLKTMFVNEKFCKNKSVRSYKKVVKSYKQLNKLKKYIKKNYNSPKKYLKKLSKYNKKYFKKKSLIFVTESNDMNSSEYVLSSVEKKGKSIVINITRNIIIRKGISTPTVIIDGANSYFIDVKKTKIKKVKIIKVVYKDNRIIEGVNYTLDMNR